MAIWEIHNESTSLYCNQCNVIVCEDCLKSKQHYMHDTSGNISEVFLFWYLTYLIKIILMYRFWIKIERL